MVKNVTMEIQPFSTEWFMSFKDPRALWEENWFALVLEVASAAILYQIYRKAKINRPEHAYLVITAVVATTTLEVLPIIPRPGYLLWWYHQGFLNVLKQRVPSYVISMFALAHYMSHRLSDGSNLPVWTRSVATAVAGLLISFPFLHLMQRLLLIMFHHDDPIFRDQIAGVPTIQMLVMLLLFFHTSHLFHQNFVSLRPEERNAYNYVKCALHSGVVSGIYALVEQYLLYILINLTMQFNTAVCLLAAVSILVWLASIELREYQMVSYSMNGMLAPLKRKEFWFVVATLLFFSTLPLWLNPKTLKSTSNRLEMGACHYIHQVANTSPLEIERRRYVCPEDVNRMPFDFHCVSKKELKIGVQTNTSKYTVCGKPFKNPVQISRLLGLYSVACVAFFYLCMMFTFTFKVQEKKVETSKLVE